MSRQFPHEKSLYNETRPAIFLISVCSVAGFTQPASQYNLRFDSLAKRWDEAIPLGNGWLGALIWQKDNHVRISLDRVDLWDDRPMGRVDKLSYKWVVDQVNKGEYDTVQQLGDVPYEIYPAPSKIPGAALEFDLNSFGKVVSNELDIRTGLSVIKFENGVVFNNYIHASKQIGYFGFENCKENIEPLMVIPAYVSEKAGMVGNSVEGQGLDKLGYAQGTVTHGNDFIRYHQPAWNGSYYEVLVQWTKRSNGIIGQWTITHNKKAALVPVAKDAKEPTGWASHLAWWKDYWSRSAVSVPDSLIAREYYLEMYKFGCVARSNTSPISLQAIWTADNGNLPPWKGDLHHDLNTQLSYWPGYSGNHLDLTASYTGWLWKTHPESERWTRHYFGTAGLNMPGVTSISGKPMGGWVPYSNSLTTAAWMAQHFYWQWKYSMSERFLKDTCLPYFEAVAQYLSGIRFTDRGNHYAHLLSSSPEYHDNTIKAWFRKFTNYDLSLVKSFYKEYVEVRQHATGVYPSTIVAQENRYPSLDVNETGLTIAPGQNLDESHRHHAHLMAIYPLGLLSTDKEDQKKIIDQSLHRMQQEGTRGWCGFSFSWAACIYARAREGDSAANMLNIFADNFVSINSFHLNGDQKGGHYAELRYRPFTLEGNFAFAQGVHEMLLQSFNGYIEVFPAVPDKWRDVSFNTLRTEGGFLVSAKKENGVVTEVTINASTTGLMQLKLPFKTFLIPGAKKKQELKNGILSIAMHKGETVIVKNGFE